MSIQLKVNEHTFTMEVESLRDKLVPGIEAKLAELSTGHSLAKSMVKSAVAGVLGMMGVHNTTGEDTLTFAAKLVLEGALRELEKTGIEIEAEEVKLDASGENAGNTSSAGQ